MKTLRQFFRNPLGLVGAFILFTVVFIALFGPLLAPYDPYKMIRATKEDVLAPPGPGHILGQDDAGKDVFSELLYGARISLIVGLAASAFWMLLGTTVGIRLSKYLPEAVFRRIVLIGLTLIATVLLVTSLGATL